MSNFTEFGGGDSTLNQNDDVIKSITQYNGAKSKTKAEINSIYEIVHGFKKDFTNMYSDIIRDQNHQLNEMLKCLCDCDTELKFISDYNKQVLQIFESWVQHEKEKFNRIKIRIVEISSIIKDFSDNSLVLDESKNKENDEIMAAMSDKLKKVYQEYVVHQKKVQLEDFVKKLIQDEDLF